MSGEKPRFLILYLSGPLQRIAVGWHCPRHAVAGFSVVNTLIAIFKLNIFGIRVARQPAIGGYFMALLEPSVLANTIMSKLYNVLTNGDRKSVV